MTKKQVKKSKESILANFPMKDGKFIFKLEEPIKHGKETIVELELMKPKAKHIRDLSAEPNMSEILDFIGAISAQPSSVIDELSMGDVTKLGEFMQAFN
jgi:hypothetical protein